MSHMHGRSGVSFSHGQGSVLSEPPDVARELLRQESGYYKACRSLMALCVWCEFAISLSEPLLVIRQP